MAYFDGIQVGDKFYVGEKEFEVGFICGNRYFHSTDEINPLSLNFNGEILTWPESGQIAFWQPIHIDPPPKPPKPKRKVKKVIEVIVNYYPQSNYWGGVYKTIEEAERNASNKGVIQVPIHHEYEIEE